MRDCDLERSEMFIGAERDRAVAGVCATVAAQGRATCRDCGEEIEPARRAAAPFTERCLECQQSHERGR